MASKVATAHRTLSTRSSAEHGIDSQRCRELIGRRRFGSGACNLADLSRLVPSMARRAGPRIQVDVVGSWVTSHWASTYVFREAYFLPGQAQRNTGKTDRSTNSMHGQETPPFRLRVGVVRVDHNHHHDLLMHIDSCKLVGHRFLQAGKR